MARQWAGVAAAVVVMASAWGAVEAALPDCADLTLVSASDVEAAVAAAVTAAESACGVASGGLLLMEPPDRYSHGSNTCAGDAKFCDDACVDAVAAVVRAWGVDWDVDCTTSADFGEERRAYRKLLLRMYECRPPKSGCVDLLSDLTYWTQTAEGRQCSIDMQEAREAAAVSGNDTSVVDRYESWCNGACGEAMRGHLAALSEGDCRPWPAYIARKEVYDMFCSSVDGDWCNPFYQPLRRGPNSTVLRALDNSSAVDSRAARNDLLAQICEGVNGTCFTKIQRIKATNFRSLRTLSREPELCISEPLGGGSAGSLYCLPAFDAAAEVHASVDVVDVVSTSQTSASGATPSLANLSALMCDAGTMRRCAHRVWGHRAARRDAGSNAALLANLTGFMQYACFGPSNGVGLDACYEYNLPGAAPAGEPLFERGDYLVALSGESCVATDQGGSDGNSGRCLNPTTCQSGWVGSTCPSGCAATVQSTLSATTGAGCCVRTWKDYMAAVSVAPRGSYFDRIEHLASVCSATVQPPCNTLGTSTSAATVTVSDVPFAWAAAFPTLFQTAVKIDLARDIGLQQDTITISSVTQSGDNAAVTFTAAVGNSSEASAVLATIEHIYGTTGKAAALGFPEAAAAYTQSCASGGDVGADGQCTSAAAPPAAPASLATVLAVAATALLAQTVA